MEPLIQSFTKTLSPCGTCGSNAVDYFIEQKQKGEKMTFILQVQVESEGDESDLFSLANSDRSKWKVISGNPARQQTQTVQAGGMSSGAGGQNIVPGSQFQRTTTVPTPTPAS